MQWIKYVRRLQPCEKPAYKLLQDYIANSGGSSRGSTALWDTRDAWMQTARLNTRKRSAEAAACQSDLQVGLLSFYVASPCVPHKI